MVNTVIVEGTVRDQTGELYEGALIEALLINSSYISPSGLINRVHTRTFSNSYGKFWLELTPSPEGFYYQIKVVHDYVQYYNKLIPSSISSNVTLDALPNYVSGTTKVLGTKTNSGGTLTLPTDNLEGTFVWNTFNADGVQDTFTVAGDIFIITLNGVVQLVGNDYSQISSNTITFNLPPIFGDVIGIQYRVSS